MTEQELRELLSRPVEVPREVEARMAETYRDQTAWNRMSLHNIARSGVFAADRAVAEYADHIWHVPHK